jgi:hypothetical protein
LILLVAERDPNPAQSSPSGISPSVKHLQRCRRRSAQVGVRHKHRGEIVLNFTFCFSLIGYGIAIYRSLSLNRV